MAAAHHYYSTGKGLMAAQRGVPFTPKGFDSYTVGSVRAVIADRSRPRVKRLAVFSQTRQMWMGLQFDGNRYVGGKPIKPPPSLKSRISVNMPVLKNLPSHLLKTHACHDMCARFDAHTMHYLERSRELLAARNVRLDHMEVDLSKMTILNNASLLNVKIPANHLILLIA